MSLIPGKDAAASTTPTNRFHSFYFFTYTVITTGFGEMPPEAFTNQQAMGVIAWLFKLSDFIEALHGQADTD